MDILDRFLEYARIDTQSDEESATVPSTQKQFDLARLLGRQLEELGASDVRVTDQAYVYAKIPSNLGDGRTAKRVGFISHMDTSPSASGAGVNPRIVEKYDGGEIRLNENTVLSPKTFPQMKDAIGCDLVVTDGTTLLGADDKAGVAEIMDLAQYLLTHPEVEHGDVCIGFTPDEEIGRGADCFDIPGFGADVAFTVDGGTLGEIEYENFNAAAAKVAIRGVNVHPGSAKDKMINASLVAMEFDALLPPCRPSNTEGYEGFFHLTGIRGDESDCVMSYIIRDHDRAKFEEKKRQMAQAAETLNEKYAETAAKITCTITDSYYNMKEQILPHMYLIDTAKEAFNKAGVEPKTVPIRGGTDGAHLSYEGLPCPNLSTGGENYHGIYEYLNVNAMRTMAEVLRNIVAGFVG